MTTWPPPPALAALATPSNLQQFGEWYCAVFHMSKEAFNTGHRNILQKYFSQINALLASEQSNRWKKLKSHYMIKVAFKLVKEKVNSSDSNGYLFGGKK